MEILIAAAGISLVVVGNISAFAYCYGKLSQKVEDIGKRMDRVEAALSNMCKRDGRREG